jgi:putative nucleotidyltransferase with HDIG domain
MVAWSIFAFLVLADIPETIFWMRFMTASALWSIVLNFHFVRYFLKLDIKWGKFITIYGIITSGITISTDLIMKSAHIEQGVVIYEFGELLPALGATYLLLFYIVYLLIREYRSSISDTHKNRLLYLILGVCIIISGSFINFTPLGKYPLDIAANGISALLIAYVILRYQLLDIRLVIRQGLFYSIPTIVIGTTYFLIITLSLQIFDLYSGVEIFLLSLVVAVITAMVAEPLRLRAQQVIDQMFFREKYDSRLMLQSLSGRVSTVLDLYEITKMILDEVASTLHITKAAFFLRDEETKQYQLTSQIGLDHYINISFRLGHPVVMWLASHDQPLTDHDLEVHPQFNSMWRKERQDLNELEVKLLIPLKVQKELIGIFSIGPKKSEQEYSEDDQLTLLTLANQSAVAIENARLYTAEQNRLKEMDTLYSMARRLVATDNFDAVVRTVARHASESVGASYARIVTREENGDYFCRAVYPHNNGLNDLRDGWKESLVAEYFYSWILQHGEPVVLHYNDPDLHPEEKETLFFMGADTVCLSPLIGGEENMGLLILGNTTNDRKEILDTQKIRLINVISDYATSAMQRAVLHDRLEDNFLQTVVSLANAMDARDTYTRDHSQRMADMATSVGRAMKLSPDDIESVHWAAILHDIGKIGVPDEILNKKGSLTKEEWIIMKEHPIIGAQIVEPIKHLSAVAPIIRAHHEKYDGTGYPYGLEGEDIPMPARVLAVVDAYVAIRDERIYSKAHTHEEAVAELRRASGTQFDPRVVDVFCKTIQV